MTIAEMLEQRLLESVPDDEASAAQWLADAARHIEAASRILDVDRTGAFALSYDAARKACAAILLAAGLRARAVPGSHRAVIQAAAELVDAAGDSQLFDRVDRMRRDRNQAEYGSRSFSDAEVVTAIASSRAVVQLAEARLQD